MEIQLISSCENMTLESGIVNVTTIAFPLAFHDHWLSYCPSKVCTKLDSVL